MPRKKFTADGTLGLSDQVAAGGLCVGAENDAWYPIEPGPNAPIQRATYEAAARELCAGCPTKDVCLELALRRRELHGVWGGTAPWEREAMLRAAPATGQAPPAEEVAA